MMLEWWGAEEHPTLGLLGRRARTEILGAARLSGIRMSGAGGKPGGDTLDGVLVRAERK